MSLKNAKFWLPSTVWESSLAQDLNSSKYIKVFPIIKNIDPIDFVGNKTLTEIGKSLKELKSEQENHPDLKNLRIIHHYYHDGRESNNEYYLVGERKETEQEYESRQKSITDKLTSERIKKEQKDDKDRKEFERLKQKFESNNDKKD